MSRDEMVEKATQVINNSACVRRGELGHPDADGRALCSRCNATAVLDAILPQVTTVEELEPLPAGALLKGADGDVWKAGRSRFDCLSEDWSRGLSRAGQVIQRSAPLTVVWQP